MSQKGEMVFEGNGGGLQVSETVAAVCAERNIPVAVWVLSQPLSNELAEGKIGWPEVRTQLTPLAVYSGFEYFVRNVEKKFKEIIYKYRASE